MKRWKIFLLILVLLILIIFVIKYIKNPKDDGNSEINSKENKDNEITGNIVKDDSESEGISGDAVSDGISGGGSSSSSNSEESLENPENKIKEKELPVDLYTKPCSYYFLEYTVCAGVCPRGECLVDDKSCYCKDN